jgi:hypothetical protein
VGRFPAVNLIAARSPRGVVREDDEVPCCGHSERADSPTSPRRTTAKNLALVLHEQRVDAAPRARASVERRIACTEGKISSGAGAQVLGCTRLEFLRLLSEQGFDVIDYPEGDLERDAATSREIAGQVRPS